MSKMSNYNLNTVCPRKNVIFFCITQIKWGKNSARANGGPHFRICTCETLRCPNVSEKFPVHVSAESPSNISPNPSEDIPEVSEP